MEKIIIYVLCVVCLLLFLLLFIQSLLHCSERKFHRAERKDLYDRIMSGSVKEYKQLTDDKEEEPHMSAHRRVMNNWRDVKGGGS